MPEENPRLDSHQVTRSHIRLFVANQGQEPEINYDPMQKLWRINHRPKGPGMFTTALGDELVKRLLTLYKAHHPEEQ